MRVIWDNATVHRCREVRDLLSQPEVQDRLRLEPLPPYAPEANPAEALWSWMKRRRDHVRRLMGASPIHEKLF
ncbi:transposase [Halomonas maura]|uniref:transposase n=1 Tax=Halomonas maura TaxID=117606 RepID=UPI00338EBD31